MTTVNEGLDAVTIKECSEAECKNICTEAGANAGTGLK